MDDIPRDLLVQFLNSFLDIAVVPVKLTPALPGYYHAIAKDEELSQMASRECERVLNNLNDYNSEIVARCSQFQDILETAKAPKLPSNIRVEHIDLREIVDVPFLSEDQHMANLIIEEIDVADYIEQSPSP